MRTALAALLLAALLPAGAARAQAVPEAAERFEARQRDLVALAGKLGQLHRLRQVCYPRSDPDLFRERLLTLIPLEAPPGGTRLDMVDAFNAGYREAAALHLTCSGAARADYQREAELALAVTERLYAPFR